MLSLVLGLVVLLVALFGFSGHGSEVSSPTFTPVTYGSKAPAANSAPVKQQLLVQVVGAVVRPGVYQLESGARVFDAVAAAGGFTKQADQASINLVRPIADGEQILIATLAQTAALNQNSCGGTGSGGSAANLGGKLNLNRASESQLDSLPGIGPTLAGRIVDYRQANGQFASINDLAKIAGIGPKLLSQIAPKVTV